MDKTEKELTKELWEELIQEKKLGYSYLKLTTKEEDKKIINYIKTNKTRESFAFNRNEISNGTGIPINRLPYTTIVKIPNIEFILLKGRLWFTIPTIKEKFTRIFTKLIKSIMV